MTLAQKTSQTNPANTDAAIRAAQNNVIDRMSQDLSAACSTLVTSGRIEEGLSCVVTQGKFNATLDLGPGMGGGATGPSPGFYARAAIVGCVGIGVKMMAAREGLAFRHVDVAVECDFDDAALMCLSPRSAAPLATRIRIDIDTDADRALVDALVDRALAHDPWFLALRDAQVVEHHVHIVTPTSAPAPAL